MRSEVSREQLLAVAADMGWPPVRLGHTSIGFADEVSWRYVVNHATPPERLQLVVALGPYLVAATAGAQARLDAVEAATHKDADDEPLLVGDIEMLPNLRAALALTPPEVRYPVVRETAFLAVGVSSRAWTGSARLVDQAGFQKRRIVVLGPNADLMTVAHELAHCWLSPLPRADSQTISAQGGEGLRTLATREGWVEQLEAFEAREERLADALALSWLFRPGPPAGIAGLFDNLRPGGQS